MENKYDYVFKVILIGDSGVGKSSLLLRFADDVFQDNYISTIGVDLRIRTVDVEGKLIKLHIWDTAGQERFKTICAQYYRGAHAIIMVYDVTDPESFERISQWMSEVEPCMREDCLLLLVGNKSDLQSKRMISQEAGQELASRLNIPVIETSAKNNMNVQQVFMSMASEMKLRFAEVGLKNTDNEPAINYGSYKPKKQSSLNCLNCAIM